MNQFDCFMDSHIMVVPSLTQNACANVPLNISPPHFGHTMF